MTVSRCLSGAAALVLIGVTFLRWREGVFGVTEDVVVFGALDREEGAIVNARAENLWETRVAGAVLLTVSGLLALAPWWPSALAAVLTGGIGLALALTAETVSEHTGRLPGTDYSGVFAATAQRTILPTVLAGLALVAVAVNASRLRR